MENNFFKSFMDGFTNNIPKFAMYHKRDPLQKNYQLLKKNFKNMSKKNETQEKLLHKK